MNSRVQQLLQRLAESGDAETKKDILTALGEGKDADAFAALVRHLDDPDAGIQYAAIVALGRMGNPAAVPELVKPKIFRSPSAKVRRAAVTAVGLLGDSHVVGHLVEAVGDEEWIVRDQAVTELKKKIQRMVEGNDSRSDKVLLHLLSVKDNELVRLAIEGLVVQGERGIGSLVKSLRSANSPVRENTAIALGLSKNLHAVPALIESLQDPASAVRISAAEALGALRDKRAIDPLVEALKDNVPDVQQQASKALAEFGLLSTEPLLEALAHEHNKFVLRVMVLTLGEIRDTRSIPVLIHHLRNSYFLVRSAAVEALVRFGPRIVPDLLPLLVPNQTPADRLIEDAMRFDQPSMQLRAVRALGDLEEHRATKTLKKVIQEGKPDIIQAAREAMVGIGTGAWGRCCAILALKEVGDASIVSNFIRALKDDSINVRLEAVRAIGKVGGKKAIGPLSYIVRKSRHDCLRAEAMQELRDAGVGFPKAIDAAVHALKDPDWNVRMHAAGFLGNFLNDKSIRPLIPVLADPHWCVQQVVETSIHNFGKRAFGPLTEALGFRLPEVRLRSARLLADVGGAEAVIHLEKALNRKGEKPAVRDAIQQALNAVRMQAD